MKKLMIGFMLMGVAGSVSLAQTNFYTNVTNLWYQGGEARSNVLTIANARLATNTNDIAGLILKAHYHVEFLEVAAISNAFLRVIQVGDTRGCHPTPCGHIENEPGSVMRRVRTRALQICNSARGLISGAQHQSAPTRNSLPILRVPAASAAFQQTGSLIIMR